MMQSYDIFLGLPNKSRKTCNQEINTLKSSVYLLIILMIFS